MAGTLGVLYVDGAIRASHSIAGINTASAGPGGLAVGRAEDGTQTFTGWLDEIRLSDVVRPAEWIQTEYNNQSATGVRGATVPVALTGTNFVAGTVAADNPGIAVSDVAVLSAT